LKEVTFLLGIHNHQPVGNFGDVIEEAYRKAYLPFLEALERHPGVRLALHNSGILIDWYEACHPEYLERVAALAARGQVEILTGGYYEPILPAISDADKIGQIRMLTRRLGNLTGAVPRGLWLAERVWEPSLPGPLARAGVDYIMVDDAHFLAAGCEADSLWNYWLTEDGGDVVAVWPISKALRYLVPFEPAVRTIEFLENLASKGPGRVALLADDGEKFGVWPDTYARVHENGWLEEFFGLLESNSKWLRLGLPGEEIGRRRPAGRVYLPAASYSEMMEWALPTPVQRVFHSIGEKLGTGAAPEARFVRGGFWRNFLAKYPESNHMHKRSLETGRRLERATGLTSQERAPVQDDLWQSQCNCAYWHGVFGGLYLPHLRDGLYRKILSAERRLDALEGLDGRVRLEAGDLDRDGSVEYRLSNGIVAGLVAPDRGGALAEFDFFPKLRNFSHGLTRRPEAYHDRLVAVTEAKALEAAAASGGLGNGGPGAEPPAAGRATPLEGSAAGSVKSIHDRVEMKEEGLERRLYYDWYRRESLVDHFFRTDSTLELFDQGTYGEQGDFVDHPYEAGTIESPEGRRIVLRRDGRVWIAGHAVPVTIEKTVGLATGGSGLEVSYLIAHGEAAALDAWFGVEFNLSMLAGRAADRYYLLNGERPESEPHLAGAGSHDGIRDVVLRDDWDAVEVRLESSRDASLWRLPVETITQSEAGFERIYQSSCVVPHWRIRLEPGETWKLTLRLSARATA
jgi:hypothetical protein